METSNSYESLTDESIEYHIAKESLSCTNCGGNHSAEFVQCPKRVEFINVTKNIRSRNNKNTNKPMAFNIE